MAPQLFGVRSVYPLFVLLAIVVAVAVMVPAARRAGLSMGRLVLLQLVVAVAGLTGAVVYNLVEAGAVGQFGWNAFVSGGLRYPGGILAVLLVLPLVSLVLPPGMRLLAYLDLMAPSAAFAMAIMRIGCFLMGCCYGHPSDLPWALSYPPISQAARHHVMNGWIEPGAWSLPVHPLHVYLGLASLAVGLFLVWFRERKQWDGQVFLLFLALHEGAKGTLEFLRGTVGEQSVAHLRVVALVLAASAAAVLLARGRGMLRNALPAALPPPGR